MTASDPLPAPIAARLRRPSWRDPRLLVGVLLVAGSVAVGAAVVSGARSTTSAYVAAHDLVPGDTVTRDDVRRVEVNLGTESGRYLGPGQQLPEGAVVTSVVHAGELVPRATLGTAAQVHLRAVPVPVKGTLSERVRVGAQVDLWFVPQARSTAVAGSDSTADAVTADKPRRVAEGAVVEQVDDSGGGIVVGGTTTVQVLVPDDALPGVLTALQADGAVTVVPGATGTATS